MASKKRILAVDDDTVALGALKQILQQRGYEVTTAPNGDAALKVAQAEEPFELFILDVTMPGMTGLELCKELRKDPRTENTPVIFLTAKGTVSDMMEGRSAGSDLYLVKPVLASKIVSMVGMFLSSEIPLTKKRRSTASS